MDKVYGKPCLTDLPPELGKRIFEQILNSEPMSEEYRKAMVKEEIDKIKKARNHCNDKK